MSPTNHGHLLATRLATQMVKEGLDAGLNWRDLAVAMESAVTVVVTACASMSEARHPEMFVREVIDVMTERAHVRAMEVITGKPSA